MTFYMKGKRITKDQAIQLIGKDRMESRIKSAKQDHADDPYQETSWMDGMEIRFHE